MGDGQQPAEGVVALPWATPRPGGDTDATIVILIIVPIIVSVPLQTPTRIRTRIVAPKHGLSHRHPLLSESQTDYWVLWKSRSTHDRLSG